MKPCVCMPVIFRGIPSNGSMEHPAVITRCLSGDKDPLTDEAEPVFVNLQVFPDAAHDTLPATSVRFFESREQAQAVLMGGQFDNGRCCFYPDRG